SIKIYIEPDQPADFADAHSGKNHGHYEGPPAIRDLINQGAKFLLRREVDALAKRAGGCVTVTGFDSSDFGDVLRDPTLSLCVSYCSLQVGQNLTTHC